MSTSYRTYVGPYIRCAVASVEVERRRRACTNAECENHRREIYHNAFCSKCGSPVADVSYADTADAVSASDVQDEIDERMTDASGDTYLRWAEKERAHIWVANVSVPGRDYHLGEWVDFNLVEITPDQIRAELSQFEAHFANEIAVLCDRYGAAAVTLHWGVLQDYI